MPATAHASPLVRAAIQFLIAAVWLMAPVAASAAAPPCEETPHARVEHTGLLMFGVGFDSHGGLSGSIIIQERNLDILNIPTSLQELRSGLAFRGAGQMLRVEVMLSDLSVNVSIAPVASPEVLPLLIISMERLCWGLFN